ncbi:MAG: PAS domain S-box protein [Candidatus Sabulitectum sp.]|nr:PAS domain S-box protein [Candidatus Sabulitectum sp.]
MQNPFEVFARNYDDTGIAVYDHQLNFLDGNLAFNQFFLSCRDFSLPNLLAQMAGGEDFLSQMMMYVEMEHGVGACNVAYNSDGNRWEFKVRLIAHGEGENRKYICSFKDVTEFLFSQKVLMNRANSLEKLDRNSPVGVFKAAATGSLLYVNNGLVSMLGYDNEHQLYKVQLSEIWATFSDREKLLSALQKDKTVNGFETRWRRRGGTLFWVSLTATCQQDRNGNIICIEVVVIDIEEKKRTEEDLRRLQNRLNSTIDSKTAELKRSNNLLLKEVAVRQRAESVYAALHSIAEETVSTESLKNLLEFIHNQLSRVIHTPNLYFAFYNQLSDTYTFPYSVDIEDGVEPFVGSESMKGSLTDHVRTTGQPLLVDKEAFDKMVAEERILPIGTSSEQWMGVPLRGSDGIWGVLVVQSYSMKKVFSNTDLVLFSGLAESISMAIDRYRAEQNRKRIESLYNTVVDNLRQGVIMCDPADKILFANEAFSNIVGIPADQLKGMSLSSLISSRDAGRTASVREMRSMGERSSYQLALIRPDKEKILVTVSGIPRFEDGDTFMGTIGLFDVIEEGEHLLE